MTGKLDQVLILKYEAMIQELKTQLQEKEKLLEEGSKSKIKCNQEGLTKYIEDLDLKLSQTEVEKEGLEQEIQRLKSQVIVSEEVQPFLLVRGL